MRLFFIGAPYQSGQKDKALYLRVSFKRFHHRLTFWRAPTMARDRIIPRDLHLFTSAQLQPLESALPARWPGSWCDLARIFFIGMLNAPGAFADPKEMAKVAMEQVRVAARQIGGRNTYIPTCVRVELEERDESIRAEFHGTNYQELAAKHGLTESRIRQIVDEALCNKSRGARR